MTVSFFDSYEPPVNGARPGAVDALEVATPASSSAVALDLPALARLARELGPRDLPAIVDRARQIGRELGSVLSTDPRSEGSAAFYKWQVRNRDGSTATVEGPTIDLMDALAGEWGRLTYQIEILREAGSRVWLRARVIDLVTLVIHERPYVAHLREPPGHLASKHDEAERWRVMQLQSAESKAIRGVLERVIPQHVQLEALAAAREAASSTQLGLVPVTGKDGKPIERDGRPQMRRRTLAEAVDEAVRGLSQLSPPVPLELVERWLGRLRSSWIASDLGALRQLYRRWRAGELTVEILEREVAELEAGRGSSIPVAGTLEAPVDRLESLGLGSAPGAGATPPPRASEATPVGATASGGGSPPGVQRGEGEGRPVSDVTTRSDRDRLRGELEQLRAEYPELVGRYAATLSARAPAARIAEVLDTVRREIEERRQGVERRSAPAPAAPPAGDDDEEPDLSGAELLAEIHALSRDLGPDALPAALRYAKIPQLDGAPDPVLRRVLEALLERIPV